MRVKYEDILERPKQVIPTLYKFMGIEKLTPYAFEYLKEHNKTVEDPQAEHKEEVRKVPRRFGLTVLSIFTN